LEKCNTALHICAALIFLWKELMMGIAKLIKSPVT
jgi:hypothetical protein